jgi:DNA-binding transcriptional ArsR family regulator
VSDVCDVLCLDLPRAEELRRGTLAPVPASAAARRARGLADPTRLMLAASLGQADELCVCDLSWIAGRPQNLVSHHLRVLREAGLAESRREGKLVLYALTEAGRTLLDTVLAAVPSR